MALDEQLIGRSNQREEKADNSESNAPNSGYGEDDSASRSGDLRSAIQETKSGLTSGSQGDLRADRMAANRQKGLKARANKAVEEALAPARKATSGLLKAAWENLITTFGLTLLWIDIHVFLNMVMGKKLFCDLGEEWIPEKSVIPITTKK